MYTVKFYRCNDADDKHAVFISKNDEEFPSVDEPTTEMTGNGNVIIFSDIDFNVVPDVWYKWRVDCVEGNANKRRQSEIWRFKMQSEE